jgi:hypothetical protein
MKVAVPALSSNGGGWPQQTNSAQDWLSKFAISAVTKRSGCWDFVTRPCSRTAAPASVGSVRAMARHPARISAPVWLAGMPVPITSPISTRRPNLVCATS